MVKLKKSQDDIIAKSHESLFKNKMYLFSYALDV